MTERFQILLVWIANNYSNIAVYDYKDRGNSHYEEVYNYRGLQAYYCEQWYDMAVVGLTKEEKEALSTCKDIHYNYLDLAKVKKNCGEPFCSMMY